VNGRPVTPESPETTAQMILPLPAGTERIRIKFVDTPDRIWGELISSGACLVFLILVFLGRAKRPSPNGTVRSGATQSGKLHTFGVME